jgi:hypothetical protein
MIRKGLSVAVVFVALTASSGSALALTSAPLHAVPLSAGVHQVTFWARPFPYFYNWSLVRACTRYEPVETARGTRLQRVWVCREKSRRR